MKRLIGRGKLWIWMLAVLGCAGISTAAELPPDENAAAAAIDASPRHSEFVELEAPETGRKIHTLVVYPERKDAAPIVIVIHEIFGLTDWVKGVADQLAKEGFIAIAPDFITGKGPNGGNSDSLERPTSAVPLVSALTAEEIEGTLRAATDYAKTLPSGNGQVGAVGYCWGGRTVLGFASTTPGIGAAVSYYGPAPAEEKVAQVQAPILAFYGESDNRVTASAAPVAAAMAAAGKSFEHHIYAGAGHGFLRQQDGMEGANLAASREAWPRTLEFFRTHLSGAAAPAAEAQP